MQSLMVFSGRANMKPFAEVKDALEWLIKS